MENDKSESLFFIHSGKIAMIHKQSHTFITDLDPNHSFGELGFLTGEPRTLSAKTRDYS
jgi:CRP-like cAMP-binding protein